MSDAEQQVDYDPALKPVLLDLFTEIAILEHLVRTRLEPKDFYDLTAAQFGVMNYFCRLNKAEERVSGLAWCFQVEPQAMHETVGSVVALGYLHWNNETDPCVRITDAGRQKHAEMIESMAPDIAPVVSEIDPDHLRITAHTLMEIRRTLDNLPDR
jgi:DNA-binding MarR family transcriptional regulator